MLQYMTMRIYVYHNNNNNNDNNNDDNNDNNNTFEPFINIEFIVTDSNYYRNYHERSNPVIKNWS